MRVVLWVTLLASLGSLAACSTTTSDLSPSRSSEQASASSDSSVLIERGLDGPPSATTTSSSAQAQPIEHGIVFGGFADVIGGMTLSDVRSRGWVLERTGGGDGCVDYGFRRGADKIQIGSKGGSEIVSTVSVPSSNGRLSAETARIHAPTATYAQIVAAYQDASISYTPPIGRGPSGSVAKLVVASDTQPDRAILFTSVGSSASAANPPPADTVFSGAQGGTLSALSGGSFGCA